MARFGSVGFGDDGDDVEDVDAALSGEVFAANDGCADDDKREAFVGVFGDLEVHGFDGHDDFGGGERVSRIA